MAEELGNTNDSLVTVDYGAAELSIIARMSPEEFDDIFDPGDVDFFSDCDEGPRYKEWICIQCKGVFIDADEHPDMNKVPAAQTGLYKGIAPQMYWLGPNELFCAACAQPRGIPPTL